MELIVNHLVSIVKIFFYVNTKFNFKIIPFCRIRTYFVLSHFTSCFLHFVSSNFDLSGQKQFILQPWLALITKRSGNSTNRITPIQVYFIPIAYKRQQSLTISFFRNIVPYQNFISASNYKMILCMVFKSDNFIRQRNHIFQINAFVEALF